MNLFYFPFIFVVITSQAFGYRFIETKIPQGHARGLILLTPKNRDYFAFLGIPYATAPTGNLRFKPSISYPGWSGVFDATRFRLPCPQVDFKGNQIGEENCLFLNVFTPKINSFEENKMLFPVMVYIQAESFENGDSALYGPEKLVDMGIVVVTFNYRLGVLGFLSTGDEAASGNWGLHDQKLALEWVRGNIAHFAGDPNLVTIFGQGAGAASVIYHLVSPLSQGLFHRAIAQSGSALCEWAIERSPTNFAKDIGFSVGCPTGNSVDLLECLRRTSVSKLLQAQTKGKIFGEFPQRAAPVIERFGNYKFIPDDPKVLLQNGRFNRVPLMAGLTQDETSYFYPLLMANAKELRESSLYLENSFLPRFLDAATPFKNHPKQKEIQQSIMFRYFNGFDSLNISDFSSRFINMSTDALYLSCVDETLKLYSKSSQVAVFMYLFAYRGQNTLVNLLIGNNPTLFDTGVCHGDELFYLFNLKVDAKKYPPPLDERVSERMITLWTDFAKNGFAPSVVNYEYPKWSKFSTEYPNYYHIGTELRPSTNFRQAEAYFWTQQLPGLFGPLVQPLLTAKKPIYKTLAWTMIAVSISLLLLIIILLTILYYQRKSQSFVAQPTENGSRISVGSTLY